MKYRSTHPSYYYGDQRREPSMAWRNPTWLERNGEFIVAAFGLIVTIASLGAVIGALVAGVLS
jgi:hypothetical protein